ncbi:hypothetical protein BH23BAC1_BH23BAC1_46070 [soil metagenome]
MIQKFIKCNLLPALAICLSLNISGCSDASGEKNSNAELDAYFNSKWAANKLWDDGNAEVAKYDAQRIIYGKPRHFEYIYILVKEDFNEEFNVKTDDYDRNDLFNVMKVNQFARIETENYPYHLLSCLFYKRNIPASLHKATISSQEWCGNTFKVFNNNETGYEYKYNSYWDGQGEGNYNLPEKILFEDQLSYTFRALNFRDELQFNYDIVESQITNKANEPQIYNATIEISDNSLGENNTWLVSVKLDNEKVNEYTFEKEYPNLLVSQKTWDGRNMQLKSTERKAYWVN